MNLKSNKKLMLAAAIVIVLNFSSCKKYEEGPFLSLRSKTARLTGKWEVVKIDNQTPDEVKIILEFEKDGDFSFGFSYDGYTYSYEGDWEWGSKKETIDIEFGGDKTEWEILRLKNDELWFEDEDHQEWHCEKD